MRPRTTLLGLATLLLLLTGCVTVTQNDDPRPDGPEPTARSTVDGVETWDLTGEPSEQALGIADDSRAGIYETDEARPVVYLLPDDTRVEVETKVVSFERAQTSDGSARFRVGVRGPTVPPQDLVEQLRSVTSQLGVDDDGVDSFADDVAAAPPEQTERVRFSSPTTELGALVIGLQADVAPIAEGGRLVIGGVWG